MHHDELNTYEQNLLNEVLQRAATDLGFRERLLNEPHRVLAEIADQELPRDFVIRFIEKDKDTDALVVLPDLVPETAELSGAELEAVAGGQMTCYMISCQGVSSIDIDVDV